MGQHGGVVHQVARREVVGAVEDQVVLLEQFDGVLGLEAQLVQHDLDQRVDLEDRVTRALRLRAADIRLPVDDLALQVRLVDDVELNDADGPDTRGREVQQRRRAQPARADHQHTRVLEPLLPVEAEVGDDQMAAVTRDLVTREFCGWFNQRR